MRVRSILCPVDFSEGSREALRRADDIARRTGGRLSVVYVNDPGLFLVAAAALHRRPQFLRRSQVELERFADMAIAAGRRPACSVLQGRPPAEILKAAARRKCDLIVMGTHGLRGFDKLFVGSTTDHVLGRVNVPLLAVPPSNRTTTGAIARVVIPVDLEGEWKHELAAAAEIARVFGADLTLLYVVPRTQAPPWLRENVAAYDRRRLPRARRALERLKAEVPSGIRTACRVVIGRPADEIAAIAAEGPRSLVVMGLRNRLPARRGSTTHDVLTHALVPVLVVPRPARPDGAPPRERRPRAAFPGNGRLIR